MEHFAGLKQNTSDVIGIYPLLPDQTTRLLVFDFDEHETIHLTNDQMSLEEEVAALRKICSKNNIPHLTERSRSGKGVHVWIFFEKPILASIARHFGQLLLDNGAEQVNLKSFLTYDRMLPAQDSLKDGAIGNLVALPWQGQALLQGNTCFVDENMMPYTDQWTVLKQTGKLSEETVRGLINQWTNHSDDEKPWNQAPSFNASDVLGIMEITLANAIYVKKTNLRPRIQNQIRRMARYRNPVFFKNQAMGLSNYETTRWIYLGTDEGDYLSIPRGLADELFENLEKAEIGFQVSDEREKGTEIQVNFTGNLRAEQKEAADQILSHDNGILCATTSFGKTVVSTYMIAQRKTNTLILLEKSSLIDQWKAALERFLEIEEPLPIYKTPTGRIKTRTSHVGLLQASHDSTNGIIDIAMVGSLCKKGVFHRRLENYGMILVDECHHSASETILAILRQAKAKYVYGVTATPIREDGHQKTNFMLIGPIRHSYTAKERAIVTGIQHYVYPRFTRTVYPRTEEEKRAIYEEYDILRDSKSRNEQIISDTVEALSNGRTPVVLTRFTEHAKVLYDKLQRQVKNVFLLSGEQSLKQRQMIRNEMDMIPSNEPLVLIGTGQLIGEGFDFPRLDTLIMAMPIAGKSVATQYAGRLDREHPGKTKVIIYDYIDQHIPVFEAMYHKRMRAYKELGYEILQNSGLNQSDRRLLFDSDTYEQVFLEDLCNAQKQIVISCPSLNRYKVNWFIQTIKAAQLRGVKIYLSTWDADTYAYGKSEARMALLELIHEAGIFLIYQKEQCPRYALIDKQTIWYGDLNLLGKADADSYMMRISEPQVAEKMLEELLLTII